MFIFYQPIELRCVSLAVITQFRLGWKLIIMCFYSKPKNNNGSERRHRSAAILCQIICNNRNKTEEAAWDMNINSVDEKWQAMTIVFYVLVSRQKKNIRWKITSTPNRQNKFNMPPDQKSLLNRLQ